MFTWKEKYSVGHKKLDDQHKKLLDIGRELVYVLENTSKGIDQYDKIAELLQEMTEYTKYHFENEEKIMEEHNFIDLDSHRFQHKIFVKKLEEIDLENVDTNQQGSVMKLLDFIADWIQNHILEMDKKYSVLFEN
ncbi:MAG: bacteriohemerythrin [Bacillota bacterium]